MSHLKSLFDQISWWLISPSARFPEFEIDKSASVGAARDGSFALIYRPASDRVSLKAGSDGRRTTFRWYNPSNGKWYDRSSPLARSAAPVQLTPPAARNAAGLADWVLLIERATD
jgi:hypothetical protein